MLATARYDGLADWYDENLGPFTAAVGHVLRALLADDEGRCLDLGCGTGVHLPLLRELGWHVTGVDISADMLRHARERAAPDCDLVRADLSVLPFPDALFDAAVSILVHTDVDDYAAVLNETARVLRPGGRFVHVGLHPCFVGPFSRCSGAEEPPVLFRGYRDASWTDDGPGFGESLRRIVGSRHLPLADLLNAMTTAGFRLERFEEPEGYEFPRVFAVAAART